MKTQEKYQRHSIGRDRAIAMYNKNWWEKHTPAEIVRFQLFIDELAIPFDKFQGFVESVVQHPVFTHQFVTCHDLLAKEVLNGREQPSHEELNRFADAALA